MEILELTGEVKVSAVIPGRRAVFQSSHYPLAKPRPPQHGSAVQHPLLQGTRLHFVPTDTEGNMNKCLASSSQAV